MKKIFSIMFVCLLISACSSKTINGKNQTFTEYVILNKNSEWKQNTNGTWDALEAECFPGIRLLKWIKTK